MTPTTLIMVATLVVAISLVCRFPVETLIALSVLVFGVVVVAALVFAPPMGIFLSIAIALIIACRDERIEEDKEY